MYVASYHTLLTLLHIPFAVPDQGFDLRVVSDDAHLGAARAVVLHHPQSLPLHHYLPAKVMPTNGIDIKEVTGILNTGYTIEVVKGNEIIDDTIDGITYDFKATD